MKFGCIAKCSRLQQTTHTTHHTLEGFQTWTKEKALSLEENMKMRKAQYLAHKRMGRKNLGGGGWATHNPLFANIFAQLRVKIYRNGAASSNAYDLASS